MKRYTEALTQVISAIEENNNIYKEFLALPNIQKDELLYCQRTTWILWYHQALCLYMLQSPAEAQRVSILQYLLVTSNFDCHLCNA